MLCDNCGISQDEFEEYCSSCGARTERNESSASFQPLKPTPMRIPLDSKLPLVAGLIAAAGVIVNFLLFFVMNMRWYIYDASFTSFVSMLIGVFLTVYVFTLAKKDLKLISIPMFMLLLLFMFDSMRFSWFWIYFYDTPTSIGAVVSVLTNLALPIVFLLTISGKINTKIPLIIICLVNLFYGGPFQISYYYSYRALPMSTIGLLIFLFNIIFATPYLLLAVSMSKDPSKVYYEKPVYRPPAYASAHMQNRTSASAASPLSSLKRFCGACGMEISGINVFCPHCGSSLAEQLANSGQTPHYNAAAPYPRVGYADDAPSGGYAVLGFFFPVVGLILYLVWREKLPLRSKSAGKGALIGIIVEVVLVLILVILTMFVIGW